MTTTVARHAAESPAMAKGIKLALIWSVFVAVACALHAVYGEPALLAWCLLAAIANGDGRGHLVWRTGRSRFGRLVLTTPYRWQCGCPMYQTVIGRSNGCAHSA